MAAHSPPRLWAARPRLNTVTTAIDGIDFGMPSVEPFIHTLQQEYLDYFIGIDRQNSRHIFPRNHRVPPNPKVTTRQTHGRNSP